MAASITVRHNFEAAHRLPFLGGKCRNLHGHSWWAEVTITGQPDDNGVLIDFGSIKHVLREWIDTHLDHGAMLGVDDQLVLALMDAGSKVYVFDPAGEGGLCRASGHGRALPWPTVENVAELLRRATINLLVSITGCVSLDRYTVSVTVTETHVNAATAAAALR